MLLKEHTWNLQQRNMSKIEKYDTPDNSNKFNQSVTCIDFTCILHDRTMSFLLLANNFNKIIYRHAIFAEAYIK